MKSPIAQWEVFAGEAARYRSPFEVPRFMRHLADTGLLDANDSSAALWAAVAYVGPRQAPTPGDIATITSSFSRASVRGENPVNIAVAYGCGWGRPRNAPIWANAVVVMTRQFARSLKATTRLVRLVSEDFHLPRSEQAELSYVLGVGFVQGCQCQRHRRDCAGGEHGCCIREHSIANWDPSAAHLSAYVDQAVRGLAGSTLKGAAFANGMLYRELRAGMRIHRAAIEGFECADCGQVRESGVCPVHGGISGRPECKRVAMLNRLVVPVAAGGSYDSRRRLVCGAPACGSLFVENSTGVCPSCQWQPLAGERVRRKQVWVRVAKSRSGARDGFAS